MPPQEAQRLQLAAAVLLDTLTPRERETVDLIVDGYANKNIGFRLDISERTVEKHRSSAMKKLHVSNVVDLVKLTLAAQHAAAETDGD